MNVPQLLHSMSSAPSLGQVAWVLGHAASQSGQVFMGRFLFLKGTHPF
jgi:hypothetical protein